MASNGLYLQWEGKRLYRQRIPTPRILEPVSDLSFGDSTGNMVIEGDNLQVLASLNCQYAGQVDVVIIDPPYNMGKDDFRYSDKRFHDPDADDEDAVYVTNEDGGRHTKWLNFMAPRLYMLWQMLHDDRGIIFVHINDVELFRLGMLMNEVFGEENWVGTIIWKSITENNPTRIAIEHEYILCYAKNKSRLPSPWRSPDNDAKNLMIETFRQLKEEFGSGEEKELDEKALKVVQAKFNAFAKENKDLLGDLFRYKKVDARGPYYPRRNLDNPNVPGYMYDIIHPKTKKPCNKPANGWRYPPGRMDELLEEERIVFGKDEKQIPQIKVYVEEVEFAFRSVIEVYSGAGSNDLHALFGDRTVFRNPKPVELIERLLSFTTKKDSLVLDAFAGSGTTGQAVMKLNHRDKGSRRFILIEEGKKGDKYARVLTGERVKRAIETYDYNEGFAFYTTGRKVDRNAIVGLEKDALVNLICQADETGRGKGLGKMTGHKYVVARNARNEAICLVWNGVDDSEVTPDILRAASAEVSAAGLKRPFRIYGTFCRVADTPSWRFCQIPDEILAQMHINEELEGQE